MDEPVTVDPPVDGAASVAIIVVTHQGPIGPVTKCLESLQRHRSPSVAATIVVDNGAAARPTPFPDRCYGPGDFSVIRTSNRGYGAALNLAMAVAAETAPSVMVALNDDVTVTDGWLEPLVAALAEPGVGAVQPKLLFADSGLVNSVGVEIGPDGAGRDIGYGEEDGGQPSGPIDVFTGGAVAMSSQFVADLGGFDERYFLYYEDVDLARRGAERGWTFRCAVESVVHHAGGATTGSLGDDLRRLQERNRLWAAIRFADPGVVRRSMWLSVRRLRHRPHRAHAAALAQGIAAAPRLLAARRRGRGAT